MTIVTDEKKVRCNIHNYDLPKEKRNELWEVANEIALLNRSTGLLNLFEKFWNQQAGFVVFERLLYACMNEYAQNKLSASTPVDYEKEDLFEYAQSWLQEAFNHNVPKELTDGVVLLTLESFGNHIRARQISSPSDHRAIASSVWSYLSDCNDYGFDGSGHNYSDADKQTFLNEHFKFTPPDTNSKLKELIEWLNESSKRTTNDTMLYAYRLVKEKANSLIQQK